MKKLQRKYLFMAFMAVCVSFLVSCNESGTTTSTATTSTAITSTSTSTQT